MNGGIDRADRELVDAAMELARIRCHGENHTVAAAARARDGSVVTSVNAYHFTGGPCAEVGVIAAAATRGLGELDTIVAVGDRGRGIIPPCGRCRQVLLDYFPGIRVLVGPTGAPRAFRVAELLPETYVWGDHRTEAGGEGQG